MAHSLAALQAPQAPGSEMVVRGTLEGWELALILAVAFGIVLAIAWPFLRALARRMERPPPEAELLERLERLEELVQPLAMIERRVAELEERLDFAERILPRPDVLTSPRAAPTVVRAPPPPPE